MLKNLTMLLVCGLAMNIVAAAAKDEHIKDIAKSAELEAVASSKKQWTGVAVSQQKRVFVNYPRWSDDVAVSVAELLKDGSTLPYPDRSWNEWKPQSPSDRFVCVQAVYIDKNNVLWILDPAAPKFKDPLPGGPKLVKVNLKTNKIERVYKFDEAIAPPKSYLNDVRIDTARQKAFMTDSGLGAIIVLDLVTGKARRCLSEHPSTKAEDTKVVIEGKEWKQADGTVKKVHSDGIALDPSREYLYYQALTGRNLYRVPVKSLLDEKLSDGDLGKKVEHVAQSCVADGIEFGADGKLYLTSLEDSSIKRLASDHSLETVIKDNQLIWPDSLAVAPDSSIYVTTSQINLGPSPKTPYKLFKFKPHPHK